MTGIVAIDPGIANTGVAVMTGSNTLMYDTIVTSAKNSLPNRLKDIMFKLELMTELRCDFLVIENFVGPLGRSTVLLIGAMLGGFDSKKVALPHPKQWVASFFGKKKDYKKAAMVWCKKHKYSPQTQHEADALCLLEWGKKYYAIQKGT